MHAGYQPKPADTGSFINGVRLLADYSNATGAFTPVLSLVVATRLPTVFVISSFTSQTLVVTFSFAELRIDGVMVQKGGISNGAATIGAECLTLLAVAALAPGPHTFELVARTNAGGTTICRPVANPSFEGASLAVIEGSP